MKTPPTIRHLHWFQRDLRLADNPALSSHVAADTLLCVYLMPKTGPWCNVTGMGPQRDRFLRESLQALRDELNRLGQDLLVLEGSPELVLPDLVSRFDITEVSACTAPGYYERLTYERLQRRLGVPFELHRGNTLFTEDQLPTGLADFPATFTPFRKQVEPLTITPPAAEPVTLPPPPAAQFDAIPPAQALPSPALPIPGGRAAGLRRVRQFIFDERRIVSYKETRNCLDGLDGSSSLSPWLANGNLSAREVAHEIFRFEREQLANESTYWLFFELLWREFFQWRAVIDDHGLFHIGGVQKRGRRCCFDPRAFARWSAGDTDFPLVNALMHQLTDTGWMSNRGRQIVASCLINELGQDWRFGAAFFEKHLIDYDVGSNYGNWQYIAGVGADPRGGRHFNLDKQAAQHDPENIFTTKWDGFRKPQQQHVTDAADWPLDPQT
ncbi:deoxyribodipyrimidine photo-lyase [Luminiphilus syltensis NOR5-1B]|uniref:Cryptochrome DASH n=1 Tax=Luminiphilus syltensis NOR5-1B TaxID=565045 RepID=B8KWL8_9GAMM|nr:DASH family cryptochrome [Luminiphilus syltensis]EED34126.1 deoxyribodipyrimidine photo-lyase [Luminiphilus syltensis NOR5-1B]